MRAERCIALFRQLTRPRSPALGAVFGLAAAFLIAGFTAEVIPAGISSANPFEGRQVLEHAGAPPVALARFDRQLRQLWPEDAAQFESYVLQQSPADLSRFVERLSEESPDDRYMPGPDYRLHADVPKGKVFEFTLKHSQIFPGTTRRIRVYVPAEYTADKPACVYVGLDDLFFQSPTAFDNLIYKHEVPTLIAIGVRSGVAESANFQGSPRLNRSFEFDGLNDNLARFLLEEVFPEIERHKTPDGLPISLSRDPNDRAVGGVSTGGIGAFTLAWERPDAFRRVFTGIGTFVGMRGGDRYPVLIRKTEPKPIRIFMQDGSNDELTGNLGEVGDWWLSNQTMQKALEFAGYQVEHVWGEGTHNPSHAIAVFPEAMRWLWKDWPRAITTGESQNTFLRDILISADGWQAIPGPYTSAGPLASGVDGAIVFRDLLSAKTWSISADGVLSHSFSVRKPYTDMAFGHDGTAYVTEATDAKIVAYSVDGKSSTFAEGIRGSNLVVTHGGAIYVTESGSAGHGTGALWLLKANGQKRRLDEDLTSPTGVVLSPDDQWLAVAESNSHWGYSYRIQPDGSVDDKQRFYWFHVKDETDDSGARAWVTDREGRLYAATRMGVQVFDRNGRVRAILPVPGGEVTGLAFGGARFDTLYVTCADHKLYHRRVKVKGSPSWSPPIELPMGSAG